MFIYPFFISIAFLSLFLPLGDRNGEHWLIAFLIFGLLDYPHVHATLFRTYLDKAEIARKKKLYIAVPILALIVSISIYHISAILFYSYLAYFTIFHFIRQQYGWMDVKPQ